MIISTSHLVAIAAAAPQQPSPVATVAARDFDLTGLSDMGDASPSQVQRAQPELLLVATDACERRVGAAQRL